MSWENVIDEDNINKLVNFCNNSYDLLQNI